MDVSVVIVHWNVSALLDACLRSIERELRRSTLSVEVIVIDNDSDEQDFRAVVGCYPDIRLVELPHNIGYGAANNAGINLARGDALFVLNPDTELLPHSLDRLWKTLHLSSHIGLVAPLLLNPNGSIQSSGYSFPGVVNVLCDMFPAPPRLYGSQLNGRCTAGNGQLPVSIDYALGAALFARRSALLDVGLFDESYFMYGEEVDLQRRLAEQGWTRLLAPASRVIHHGGQSTAQRPDEMHAALWQSRARYYQRWATPTQRRAVRALVNVGTRFEDFRIPAKQPVNRVIRNSFKGTSGS